MTTKLKIEAYIENNYCVDTAEINSANITTVQNISWSLWFDTWLNCLSENLPQAVSYELTLRLTDDNEVKTLNSQYRQKNQPTDVLAFAALESELISPLEVAEPLYLGDIVISLDTANQQAKQQCHSLVKEVAWLASHGLLHLLGWDHPDDESLRLMLQKQADLIELVEITD